MSQEKIRLRGEEILKRTESQPKVSLFSKDYWYGSIMDWSMKNESFKTQMFRFVDVLPTLQSGSDVAKHLKEYFAEGGEELPKVFNVGLGLGSLAPSLMAGAIRKNVTQMARMFITGENPAETLKVLKKARSQGMTFTVDILGEATLSEKEALDYQRQYLELIDALAAEAASWESHPVLDRDALGDLPKVNVSVKMTALFSQINDRAWDDTKTQLKDRLRPLFVRAIEKNVFLNLDMEHYAVKHLTLEVFRELLMEPALKGFPHFGCVIQAYLRDSLEDIKQMVAFAKERGTPFTIRLVKGAYWDSETIEAQQRGWPIPVYLKKAESDANFEDCTTELLKAYPAVKAGFGSHNVRSIAHAMVIAEELRVPANGFEIQMLYGMADPIKRALVDMGYRVREYAPLGELIPGMAYLVRRLLENTSNESWLRGKFAEGKSTAELLKDPREGLVPTSALLPKGDHFENEPLWDFAEARHRQALEKALRELTLNAKVWPVISGKPVNCTQVLHRENPSAKSEVVAAVGMASTQDAERAVEAAKKGFQSWKKTSVEERCRLLEKSADIMNRDRAQLIATQVLEVGKPWAEADGDVAEAIDFCRYYAREMRGLAKGQKMGRVPGENSHYHYQARGVTAVIAPWNFPLAILTGMATAALVTGNTVIMKPAEQSSLVAAGLMRILMEAGFPADSVHLLTGAGEVVGEFLVQHPDVVTIVFTGSKSVGLHILGQSAKVREGQIHIKRCITELGGKNAIIVDSDADLDEAVDGVLSSAFGFAGQKCSACSRAIIVGDLYEKFEARLVEAARSLVIGPAKDPRSFYGPVVDQEAFDRIQQIINRASAQHRVAYQGTVPTEGYFVPPTIFADVKPDAEIAQEEIFGPVLALMKAKDLSEALAIANGTRYALTGGLFSRSPVNIQKVREEFECGNLYINRGITGALVERHPFGGFKMSGIGSKAGGPDYLKQFMEPRNVTENLVRRGFAPDLQI